jgi:hypothetical protein
MLPTLPAVCLPPLFGFAGVPPVRYALLCAFAACCLPPVLQAEEQAQYTASEREHWSLVKRSHPAVPRFSGAADRQWVRNFIDAFILAALHKDELKPAPEADRPTLIRRLSFDLLGLPPTPPEIEAFVNDAAPDAYGKLVDRLLASPHYGERWGQHWLDVVRYAESEGFEYDRHRPGHWRYRDYVVESLNADKPYDQFVREQLAGDEIDPTDQTLLAAAGFNRLGPVRRNAGNQNVASSRNEVLTEMTNVVGSALLGLTVGCARCHDHMFDPIKQQDYYRLQAFFAATFEQDVILASQEEQGAWKAKTDKITAEAKSLKDQIMELGGQVDEALQARYKAAQASLPPPLPTIVSVKNDLAERTEIHLLSRGDPQQPQQRLGMRLLGVLLPEGAPELDPKSVDKPRTRLADWIADPEHPLTARVMANRLWHYHFGQGLVATPNDFGVNGDWPVHAELLDALANALVDGGWRLKPLHRLIVTSSTYRQASQSPHQQRAIAKDPDNRLHWRFNRRRLEAEELRDAMLAVAGELNAQVGGPSVMVPVEDELVQLLYNPAQWQVAADARQHDRRSLYLIAKRNLRLPFMEVFDQPDMLSSCPRRVASTHAPQALELLNGTLSNELAGHLAERLTREAGTSHGEQVELAWQLATGRGPTDHQREQAIAFLGEHSLQEFALAMFNLNDFLYVH